ncbi:hypothetical protein [Solidesulfovibrio sp.]|uniref:hypothetical protein n=1 Tax=Solidesulfovibrio sp. TaxID=2910990 RepID=UPI0026321B2A|nr:hypothetical protein [Solidesulfovibrio sp.]
MQKPSGHAAKETARAVVELIATDAMDAVRHVAACLARRSHALLGLLCLPGPDGEGRLLVALADDGRIPRLLHELSALPGVREARQGEMELLDFQRVVAQGLAA